MDHSRVILEEFGTRLRLRALLREDAGTYTCMAGAEMYSATVAIRGACVCVRVCVCVCEVEGVCVCV